jgi:hypothetical protein
VSPALPEPDDPFLRALAEHWENVLRLADAEQRERLRGLVAGTVEPDPVDARAALADELLTLLPPDHPMVEVLRTGTMFATGGHGVTLDDVEISLERLRRLVLGPDASAEPPPSGTDLDTDWPEAADEFDQQVQARLLDLPFLSPDEVRSRGGDPNDSRVIRLPHPDRGDQLPAFQFTGVGNPWPVVQTVNEQLNAAADPWGVTCWWVDPHARLDAVPADLLGQGRDALILRAAAAVEED